MITLQMPILKKPKKYVISEISGEITVGYIVSFHLFKKYYYNTLLIKDSTTYNCIIRANIRRFILKFHYPKKKFVVYRHNCKHYL